MVVNIRTYYNGLFLEQHRTHNIIFQRTYNNIIFYMNQARELLV